MTELKTLKDIRKKAIKDICKNIKAGPEDLCSFGPLGLMSVKVLVTTFLRDDLREAAIKHIKEFDNSRFYDMKTMTCKKCESTLQFDDGFMKDGITPCKIAKCRCKDNKEIIFWIKYFFNITEEDLK